MQSTPHSVSIPLQLFLGSPSTALFFSKHVSSLKVKFALVSRPSAHFFFLMGPFLIPLFSWAPSHLCFTRMVSFQRYQYHQIGTPSPRGQLHHLRMPLVLFHPILLTKASLTSLRVTLIHFALSSYKRALCLPTTFPISCLARLGVKPRLCRSSWIAFCVHSSAHVSFYFS